MASKSLNEVVETIGLKLNAEIILYCGPIERPFDLQAIECCQANCRENLFLLLGTLGGDAHAAYRIARKIKEKCKKFTVFIDSLCKSAGTLLALGADEIIMSDYAEMGPIDVQLRKVDEIGEMSSGLTMTQALSTLQSEAFNMFERYFLDLRKKSGGQVTTKSAFDTAANLTKGLFEPIYSQIDPIRLGETDRAVRLAVEYGTRIGKSNLKPQALTTLAMGYPDHSFVIDKTEAQELFLNVRSPDADESALAAFLATFVKRKLTSDQAFVTNLTKEAEEDRKRQQAQTQPPAPAEPAPEAQCQVIPAIRHV